MLADIDECADVELNGCRGKHYGICTDNPGSYTCVCVDGYINNYCEGITYNFFLNLAI